VETRAARFLNGEAHIAIEEDGNRNLKEPFWDHTQFMVLALQLDDVYGGFILGFSR
jgi:hypothetical protein